MSISNLFGPNDYKLFTENITIGNSNTPFNIYLESGYFTNLTGPYPSPVSVDGLYRQIDRTFVISLGTITLPGGGSGVAGPIIFTTPVPLINVWTDLYFQIWVINSGETVQGTLKIAGGTGIITVYVGFNGNFSTSGNCGFWGFSITYASFL